MPTDEARQCGRDDHERQRAARMLSSGPNARTDAGRGQDRRGVGADGEERDVAQVEQAGVADHDVQAQGHEDVEADGADHLRQELADELRQGQQQQEERRRTRPRSGVPLAVVRSRAATRVARPLAARRPRHRRRPRSGRRRRQRRRAQAAALEEEVGDRVSSSWRCGAPDMNGSIRPPARTTTNATASERAIGAGST